MTALLDAPGTAIGWWPSPWGQFEYACAPDGVVRLRLPDPSSQREPLLPRDSADAQPVVDTLLDWLAAFLEARPLPATPPLALHGTDFQLGVWKALQALPRGCVASYGDLAERLNRPRAARAVGSACKANRIPLIIPCHRVVAAGGRIGGFSSPGGVTSKQRLLMWEQGQPDRPLPTDAF